jgi:hypothetical protein
MISTAVSKARRRHAARYLMVIALGAVVGLSSSSLVSAHATVSATNHCTRYAPTNVVDPANCSAFNTVSGGTIYQTSSTALRDRNAISANANQYLEIDYYESNGTIDGIVNDYASGLSYLASSTFAYAECSFSQVSAGECHTNWHN